MAVTAGEHWKVGELARATGLTVRTLHHYDEIGLLVPSLRTPAGHRLYTGEDVRLLYRLIALRRLGFGLERIAECLHDRVDPRALVADQLRAVDRRIAAEQQLRTRLGVVLNVLDRNGEVFTADFLKLIEETQMTEETIRSYYTPEQLD